MVMRYSLLLATLLLVGPVPAGGLELRVGDFPPEFESLFKAARGYYGQLQRTANGVYGDAYTIAGAKNPNRNCSIAGTGVGLMALCMDYELKRDPDAPQKALQTLRMINGKVDGFKIGREKAGFYQHFFSSRDGSGKSPPSTVDTAIMMVGVLYCRNTFSDPRIKTEADELWNSIDWSLALADPKGNQLYMVMLDGKPVLNSKTHLFNEYFILAWLIREAQLQKTGHSDVITIQELPTTTRQGLRLLCANGPWPQTSFLVQFPLYMCHPCTMDPLYRQYVFAQAQADQRACSERMHVPEFWGCGAGGVPGNGYKANSYANNPQNIVSPHIIAGFMPVFPLAQEHLLKLYHDPQRHVSSPVGDFLPRFSVSQPEWRPNRIESIDFSSMLFGLAGIHPQLGMKFFEAKTKFTFNQTK